MYSVCNLFGILFVISLFFQLTEEHNEELREIREGYEIKLKEMEKVCLSTLFLWYHWPIDAFSRIFCDILCLFM